MVEPSRLTGGSRLQRTSGECRAKAGESLWGHLTQLPSLAGGGTRLVGRTNNLHEGFFRGGKQGERRRSGRKKLTQDLEQLPADAALTADPHEARLRRNRLRHA